VSGAFGDIVDEQEADGVTLSDNVAADFVRYFRGNVVGHEEEGLLMYLSLITGWTADKNCHNNVIGKGAPGSGKSLTKNTVEDVFDAGDTYTKTSASGNAILDSVEWDVAIIAPMDEADKIDKPIVEVLKSSNPEDDGFAKDRNVEDPDARGGYSPTEVSATPNPWVLLYAPSSKKGGLDDELEDRALILYFSNDKSTRRSIGRKEFGHEAISSEQYDDEYIYDTHALAAALREHVRQLPTQRHYEETEDGDQYLAGRSGASHVYQPLWVWYAVEPIFNVDEDYTNRVYGIVNNLIRASALLNHHNRPTTTIETYVDEDSTETETNDAVVVQPQDVANVLSCLPTLLSTTHLLTPLKRHILDAVDATEPITDGDGTTVQDVRDWLNDNDIPHPSEGTLRKKMNELAENYYLQKWENAGGKRGNANVYEKRDEGALQIPNVRGLQERADRDGVTLATHDAVSIDPDDPFEGCTDPIRDQPFKESVTEFDAQFSGESVERDTSASSFMGGDDTSDTAATETDSGGQAALTDVGDDGVETATAETNTTAVELDPDGGPSDPTEQFVYEHTQSNDGELFAASADVTHYIGICDPEEHSAQTDMTDSAVDPSHTLWADRPDHTDDRVISESDALRELSDAFDRLRKQSCVDLDTSQGPPAMEQLVVADVNIHSDNGNG